MSTSIQTVSSPDIAAIESVLVQGDLSKLTIPQRITHYARVCDSLGLNPLTRPFEYLNLNGKTVLYARRDCADQLRSIRNVTVRIIAREQIGSVYVVTAQASLPNGRCDESTGAVPFGNINGEAAANALMKAETKAKRRVTLSICGLGMLDESELDGVRDQVHREPHTPHGYDNASAEPRNLDPDIAADLAARMASAEEMLEGCDSYDKLCALRAILGDTKNRSRLTLDIQAAFDPTKDPSTWLITPELHRELGRQYRSMIGKCKTLEKKLAPRAEDIAHDDPEGEASAEYDGR